MKASNFGLCLLIGLMLMVLSACGSEAPATTENTKIASGEASGNQKITIAQTTHGFLFAPLYIAQEKGFFDEEGLDVELITTGGGSKVMAAVIGGSVEIGGTTLGNVMDAAEKGQDVQVFATMMNQYASNVVIRKEIAEERGITENSTISEKIQALKGLKIAITSGSSSDKLVRYLLEMENIQPDKEVELVPLGKSEAVIPAFKNKQIDGFAFSSPTSDMGVMNDGFMLINLSKGEVEELNGFLYTGLVAKKEQMESNKELFEKVTRAVAKAEEFIKTDKEGAKEALKASFTDIDEEVYNVAFENNYPAFATSPVVTKEGYEMNVIFEGIDTPFEAVVNNEFAEKFE